MNYYLVETAPNVFLRVTNDVVAAGVVHPYNNLELYSKDELRAIGVHRVPMKIVPPNNMVTSSHFEWQNGEVVQVVAMQEIPPAVPQNVSAAQAKVTLNAAGILEPLLKIINALGPLNNQNIWFNSATTWNRTDVNVIALGTQLGLSAKQMDQLFIDASKV